MSGHGLPPGWDQTTLGAIRTDRSTSIDPSREKTEHFELYSIPAFPEGRAEIVQGKSIGSTKKTLIPGTVVLSKINPRINRVWVVAESSGRRQIGSSEWIPFFPTDGIDPRYLAYYLRQDAFRNYLAANVSGVGGSLMRVRPSTVDPYPFNLAPGAEQHRIVEALESYFTRLDEAVATLKRVQRNLKRYRASVLKAAVEGRLVPTEAELARAEGRDYEPASVLLQRILAERRRRWEETELAKMNAKGNTPKGDEWKAKYAHPIAPDVADLPELPEGWRWAILDEVAALKGGITKGQQRKPGERYRAVPYLRVANVQRGFLDLSEMKMIEAPEAAIDELRLERGDVLFNEGGDRDKLGRGWIWRSEIPECIHQNHVFRARIYTNDLLPEMLSWYGNTAGQRYFFDEGKQTTNLASINLTKLRGLPIPIPPLAEQLRIREAVEGSLSVADEVLKSISGEVARCARLRQSLLKWAFEGRLVDQYPTDEPASVLLQRIRADPASSVSRKSPRPSRRKQRSTNA